MTITRAAIYVRLSEDKKKTGENVADQIKGCTALAEAQGLTVVGTYNDNNRPASDPLNKKRPEFDRLMEDAERGEFDAVICRHADRLYRHPIDQLRISHILGRQKIVIYQEWTGYPLDLSSPTGVLQAGIAAQVALYEIDHKKQRQRVFTEGRAMEGLPQSGGGRPFGYETDKVHLRADEADALRDATKRVIEGASLASIMREWNAAGLLTTRGKDWGYPSMKALLTRWRNAGIVQRNGEPLDGVPAQWEAIVSPEELRTVRSILSDPKRRTNKSGNAIKHVLSGIITCEACDAHMRWGQTTTRAGKPYDLYQCSNGLGHCRRSILKDVAEEAVMDHVARRLALPGPELVAMTATDRAEVTRLRHDRAALDADADAWSDAKVSVKEKIKHLTQIEAAKDDLDRRLELLTQRNALATLMASITTMTTPDGLPIKAVASERQAIRERFAALDIHRQRTVIKALLAVHVLKHEKGVRPTPETAAQRVIITPLDPSTGGPLDDSYPYDHTVGGEAGHAPV